MNFFCLTLILFSILSTGLANEEVNKFLEKFEEFETTLCGKHISDDKLSELNKCKAGTEAQYDSYLKECLNKDMTTDRDRVSSVCNKETRKCVQNKWKQALDKTKHDDIVKLNQMLDKTLACLKENLH